MKILDKIESHYILNPELKQLDLIIFVDLIILLAFIYCKIRGVF